LPFDISNLDSHALTAVDLCLAGQSVAIFQKDFKRSDLRVNLDFPVIIRALSNGT
jgi:hypothetical protein